MDRHDDDILRLRAIIEALANGPGPRSEVGELVREADARLDALQGCREHLRAAEESMRHGDEASRLKDEFLATISHELRTPLSSVLGWAKLLRDGRCDPAFAAKGLDVIERNARFQQRILDDMLDVSRIIAGKLLIDTEPVDLTALAEEVIESQRPASVEKGIDLSMTFSGPCRLAGDSVRLRQVLWNLVSNAIKFTPEQGRVVVSVEQHGDRIVARVSDTGKGIEPSFLAHVFENYRQADTSTTRQHGGLGLGLAIVRHLTEMHGGTVTVDSPGPGAGAVFSVTLPVRPFSAPIARSSGHSEGTKTSPRGRPKRLAQLCVLIVEDEEDSRELIELLLASEGAVVRSAASADEALALLDEVAPDVVLSDIGMPGRDGYWLAVQLRARRPDIAAIALTAFSAPDDIERALAAGFDHHVAKPVDPELLVHALTACRRGPVPERTSTAA